jgi:hypothetical protein
MKFRFALLLATLLAARLSAAESPADAQLKAYFLSEAAKLSAGCLHEVKTLGDWESRRAGYRREYQEMLGLLPMPERTDLKPVVTGKLDHEEFTVEKLQFQAMPGLYCTGALFLPKNAAHPVPAVLYASGHYKSVSNGVSYGNKAVYQADGAWFARNGYACLVLDTVLAGEIQGIHTGTRDHGLWWWNSRGYTPAGVEAWFGIRGLDYLSTRPEVDADRFGITGHSGGGAYSWAVTALDDRIKVAAPLAGMADIQSHIGDGVIDSHCDCNFPINYHRWDFPQIAALAAPRPLLIGGTDHDGLFNLENTQRIHEKVRRIYRLHDASDKLGLAVAPGGHAEVPELQLAVLRWFNRHLKGEEPLVEMAVKKFFTPEELLVFKELPNDAINAEIAETFVPLATPEKRSAADLASALRQRVFAAWPAEELPLEPERALSEERDGLRLSAWDFESQPGVELRLYLLENAKPGAVRLQLLDSKTDAHGFHDLLSAFGLPSQEQPDDKTRPLDGTKALAGVKARVDSSDGALAWFAPRGSGWNAWSGDEKAQTRIRRRFMLLGQTVDGMRVWDIRRAVGVIQSVRGARVDIAASGTMGVNALYAALFEKEVGRLDLSDLPGSHTAGPDYLGILKLTDIPQVLEALGDRAAVR